MKTLPPFLASSILLTACAATSPATEPVPPPSDPIATHHATEPARFGIRTSYEAMEAVLDVPGPIVAETFVGGRWVVQRSGLLNLAHPAASSLEDGPEPVQLYVHTLVHPSRGLYLIDTGVASTLRADDAPLRTSPLGAAFHLEALTVERDTGAVIAGRAVAGVFLTHLHLDHVLGLEDVARDVPILTGLGEAASTNPFHAYTQSTVDGLLDGRAALREWDFGDDEVIDVFGDDSVFVLSVRGHTPGSVAIVARTIAGPVLYVGDTCHTRFGWEHAVEPGSFSSDGPEGRASLLRLEALAQRHPSMQVRLGHQE